jgi:hypothetical protein
VPEPSVRSATTSSMEAIGYQRPRQRPTRIRKERVVEDPVLTFRRRLYLRQIPSLYVGRGVRRDFRHRRSKQHVRQPVTPASFSSATNPGAATLTHLATTWIRRELQLFPFLDPSSASSLSNSTSHRRTSADGLPRPRRQTTPHYLLPYIMAVLQQIDLRGSAGQAVELISEYLGRSTAVLFCHELYAFLSSGTRSVGEWDEQVQYWFEEEGELRNGRGQLLGSIDSIDRARK